MIGTILYLALVYGLLSAIVFHFQIMHRVPRLVSWLFKPGTDAIFWTTNYFIILKIG